MLEAFDINDQARLGSSQRIHKSAIMPAAYQLNFPAVSLSTRLIGAVVQAFPRRSLRQRRTACGTLSSSAPTRGSCPRPARLRDQVHRALFTAWQPFTRNGLRAESQDARCASLHFLMDALQHMRVRPSRQSSSNQRLQNPPECVLVENVKGFDTSGTRDALLAALQAARFHVQEFLLSPEQAVHMHATLHSHVAVWHAKCAAAVLPGGAPHGLIPRRAHGHHTHCHPRLRCDARPDTDRRLSALSRAECRQLSEYLEPLIDASPAAQEPHLVPAKVAVRKRCMTLTRRQVVCRYGRLLDLVQASDRRSTCFTKACQLSMFAVLTAAGLRPVRRGHRLRAACARPARPAAHHAAQTTGIDPAPLFRDHYIPGDAPANAAEGQGAARTGVVPNHDGDQPCPLQHLRLRYFSAKARSSSALASSYRNAGDGQHPRISARVPVFRVAVCMQIPRRAASLTS